MLARRFAIAGSFLVACATLGCAETAPSSSLRFAMWSSAPSPATIRVSALDVVDTRVNLQEPVVLDVAGADVTITFARRQRDGIRVAIDPTTLESRAAHAVDYPAHAKMNAPPYLSPEKTTVALAGGDRMTIWTDEPSRRVYVQTFAPNGAARGEPVAVSPADMDVVGVPRAATADGNHVVVAFFAARLAGFELVAASLDATR